MKTDDPEAQERAELRSKIKVSSYIKAAFETRAVEGPEAEFNASIEVPPNHVPLELFAPLEIRATTDAESGAVQQSWIDRVLSQTAAARLGITFKSVQPGIASVPVTTAGADAKQRGRGEAAADAAWTVGITEIKPTRAAVRATFSEEDVMRLPGLEDSLKRDLGNALAEGIDRSIFVGDAGANEDVANITGFTTLAGVAEKTVTQANKIKPAQSLTPFVELVDGRYASDFGWSECRRLSWR